ACGTIEQCLKTLFYCHFKDGTTNQFVLNYLEKTLITKNSKNPSKNMIYSTITMFDDSRKFKDELKNISNINLTAVFQHLDSLRNLRNQIAHGDKVTTVFSDVTTYVDSCVILTLEIKNTLKLQYGN
ncbi:HEPN domain-containing protein, partial [Enterococcus sp. 7E2_DIV0204]